MRRPSPPSDAPFPVPGALVREIEPFDAAALAAGVWAAGGRRVSLLESTLPGAPWGRWTIFAPAPDATWTWGPAAAWTREDGGGHAGSGAGRAAAEFERVLRAAAPRPWAGLAEAWAGLAAARAATAAPAGARGSVGAGAVAHALPPLPAFRGGALLALSYDAARALPDFAPWEARAADDLDWPWFDVRMCGAFAAQAAGGGPAFALASTDPLFGGPEGAPARLEALCDALARAASRPAGLVPAGAAGGAAGAAGSPPELTSNMSDADYARAFERLFEYLRAGDLYQANLTRRFDAACAFDPPALYARLRAHAPAPYAALLAAPARAALSASPELFLAREPGAAPHGAADRLVTRPIKGTRPRRGDPAEDAAQVTDLLASPKDRAEHVMIVDVHRNDLGRVCDWGTVEVGTLAGHEAFPTVHHLTSTITGRPRAGVGPWEAVAAAFPAGSITGAPKKRAIEVLEELEPTRRALYCGGIGWMDAGGAFALNVAIRTLLARGGRAHFQAGGGIVIDSVLEDEAQETWNKARALHAAVAGTSPELAPRGARVEEPR